MLPKSLWDLLLSHGVYVIACGDPFQLPPVSKEDTHDLLSNPHVFLDEIMRQAADNEIIDLSMKIRNFQPFEYGKKNDVHISSSKYLVNGMYLWADQILVGTNKKRAEINNEMRTINGHYGSPKVGDKVISLENHWDISDTTGESALTNGTIGYIKEIKEDFVTYKLHSTFKIGPIPVYKITIETDIGEVFKDIIVDRKYIDKGEKSLTPKQEYMIYKSKEHLELPCLFDFGYAITTHRAQGSEWGKVLVIEERFPFDREEHARWLYTAVTRSSGKLVLVR